MGNDVHNWVLADVGHTTTKSCRRFLHKNQNGADTGRSGAAIPYRETEACCIGFVRHAEQCDLRLNRSKWETTEEADT